MADRFIENSDPSHQEHGASHQADRRQAPQALRALEAEVTLLRQRLKAESHRRRLAEEADLAHLDLDTLAWGLQRAIEVFDTAPLSDVIGDWIRPEHRPDGREAIEQYRALRPDVMLLDVDMPPPEGAAALSQGAVDFACGYGGSLTTMKEYGNVLLTGAEKEELGILVFDVTSAPASFVAENGETVAKFLKVTADANAEWKANQSEEMLAVISEQSGMDLEDTRDFIATMKFPSVEEQLSEKWLGGNAAAFMKGVADVFVEAGSIDSALDSYEGAINTGPLEAASQM